MQRTMSHTTLVVVDSEMRKQDTQLQPIRHRNGNQSLFQRCALQSSWPCQRVLLSHGLLFVDANIVFQSPLFATFVELHDSQSIGSAEARSGTVRCDSLTYQFRCKHAYLHNKRGPSTPPGPSRRTENVLNLDKRSSVDPSGFVVMDICLTFHEIGLFSFSRSVQVLKDNVSALAMLPAMTTMRDSISIRYLREIVVRLNLSMLDTSVCRSILCIYFYQTKFRYTIWWFYIDCFRKEDSQRVLYSKRTWNAQEFRYTPSSNSAPMRRNGRTTPCPYARNLVGFYSN